MSLPTNHAYLAATRYERAGSSQVKPPLTEIWPWTHPLWSSVLQINCWQTDLHPLPTPSPFWKRRELNLEKEPPATAGAWLVAFRISCWWRQSVFRLWDEAWCRGTSRHGGAPPAKTSTASTSKIQVNTLIVFCRFAQHHSNSYSANTFIRQSRVLLWCTYIRSAVSNRSATRKNLQILKELKWLILHNNSFF